MAVTMNLRIATQRTKGETIIHTEFDVNGMNQDNPYAYLVIEDIHGVYSKTKIVSNGSHSEDIYVPLYAWYKVYLEDSVGVQTAKKAIMLVFTTIGQGADSEVHTFTASELVNDAIMTGVTISLLTAIIINSIKSKCNYKNTTITTLEFAAGILFTGVTTYVVSKSRAPLAGDTVLLRYFQYSDRIDVYHYMYNSNGILVDNKYDKVATIPYIQF